MSITSQTKKYILVTGGAGFIGANFIKKIASQPDVAEKYSFVVLDALTYAGKLSNIESELRKNSHLTFVHGDIRDSKIVESLFESYPFSGVINYAAESHVDRSIKGPKVFIDTNVMGTLNLLDFSWKRWKEYNTFRYLQVSTDEVYGSLKEGDAAFTEQSPLAPNSPYSASKASADMLVRSYFKTHGLPSIITRCSNNYGPHQLPEKLIPLVTTNCINNKPIPVYGDGRNIRDWIYVDDHNDGVWKAFLHGRPGEIYNFGGESEKRNIDIVKLILKKLNKSEDFIQYVTDRKGHDWRYAIDIKKAKNELNWQPQTIFENGIDKTLNWYLSAHNVYDHPQTL